MPTYVTLLRGINLAGHKRMKMERVRAMFAALGHEQVKTYLQSGNVVFRSPEKSAAKLSEKIEKQIVSEFRFEVPVLTLSAKELSDVAANNPFLRERGIDTTKLHVTLLSAESAPAAVKKLETIGAGADQFRLYGRQIYLYCPNGYGRTKLSNNVLEKALSVRATTRNWQTVTALRQMCEEYG